MKSRETVRRAARAVMVLSLVGAAMLMVAMAASTRYRAAVVGAPFWRSTEVTRGCLNIAWFPVAPDGSRPGFGNPGIRFDDTDSWGLRVLPRARLSGAVHIVSVPLWAPALILGGIGIGARRAAYLARDKSKCFQCGYSLAGLSGGRCPECGGERRFAAARLARGLMSGVRGVGHAATLPA